MKIKSNNKGVSLAITIGLLLLLITLTATINLLVIQALRASHQIEASDKAYFAAEAGIEDALYELSAHAAGYETPPLGDPDVRNADFTQTVEWVNEWELQNRGLNDCDGTLATWEDGFAPDYCGRIFGGQKLVINLFMDDANAIGPDTNAINTNPADINTLLVNSMTIKFRVPSDVFAANTLGFASGLLIDNDRDLGISSGSGPEAILGLNEDRHPEFQGANTCPYSGGIAVEDNDCDGREDEDSPEDPVFLWNVVDGSGNSLQQLRGCKGDTQHPSHDQIAYPPTGHDNAGLCEKNFTVLNGNELSVTLDQGDKGINQDGNIMTLGTFLGNYNGATEPLQMEILAVAPMNAISIDDGSRIPIPYYEYGIDYDAGGAEIPSTFFSIKSDGHYLDFKQSITTNVVPRATTRLLDLTIIQQ